MLVGAMVESRLMKTGWIITEIIMRIIQAVISNRKAGSKIPPLLHPPLAPLAPLPPPPPPPPPLPGARSPPPGALHLFFNNFLPTLIFLYVVVILVCSALSSHEGSGSAHQEEVEEVEEVEEEEKGWIMTGYLIRSLKSPNRQRGGHWPIHQTPTRWGGEPRMNVDAGLRSNVGDASCTPPVHIGCDDQ